MGKPLVRSHLFTLQDRTSIEAVISWHQATVDENREKHYPYQMSDHMFSGKVTYHLKRW